ncbi:MAG: hypothetical protein ABEJ23_01000 [Haloarculaceae archaeon]
MTRHVLVEDECVPADATVRHYDELTEPVKERLPSLLAAEDGRTERTVAADLTAGEYIKYTDYYRVATR